jgi:lysophospholipase L1-like esterase
MRVARRPPRPVAVALVAVAALLLVAVVAPLARETSGQTAPASVGPGDVMLALGDSLAVGVGGSLPDERGFVGVLHGWVRRGQPAPGLVVRNLAESGATSVEMIERGPLQRARDLLRQAREEGRRVSPVVLSVGGNDLLRVENRPTEERRQALTRFTDSLDRILDGLVAEVTVADQRRADLVLLTIYNPRGGDANVVGTDAWWVEQFNAVLRRAAADRSLVLVDAHALMQGNEQAWTHIGAGDVHPTNAGHRALAEAALRALGYDRLPPTVALVAPAAGDLARLTPTVSVRVEEEVALDRVELWVDGHLARPLLWLPEYGVWATVWDARAVAAGPRRLEVRAVDVAGNIGQADVTVRRP